jgi:hypothetical protein
MFLFFSVPAAGVHTKSKKVYNAKKFYKSLRLCGKIRLLSLTYVSMQLYLLGGSVPVSFVCLLNHLLPEG